MMTSGSSNNSLMSEINVTPFVDVMLVLLIIFMVTAPMMTQGVDVALPEASSESLPADEEQIVVTIDKAGNVYISEYPVSIEFLKEKLNELLKNKAVKEVYLKADRDISYGIVVRVMSEIKGAGVEKLGMLTEPVLQESEKNKKS